MDPRTIELDPVASRESSLSLYLDNDNGAKSKTKKVRTRQRACPILALLGLLVHMIACCCGATLSVLIVRFGLQVTSAGRRDLVARILLFVASCMGVFYVLMHLFAAREKYVRSHQNGTPQIYGYFTVAVAILVMRLVIPVWMGAVVLTALVAAHNGLDLSNGIQGNVVWVQLLIASVALISLIVMVLVVETTDRPFATSIFSRKTFIRGMDDPGNAAGRADTFEFSVSRQGFRPGGRKHMHRKDSAGGMTMTEQEREQMGFDRSMLNTPESPELLRSPNNTLHQDWQPQRPDTLRTDRVRSQPVPTPLEAIFTSDSVPPDAQDIGWRPPTRDSTHAQQQSLQVPNPKAPGHRRPSIPNIAMEPPSSPPDIPLPSMPVRAASRETNTPAPLRPRSSVSERPSTAPQPDVRGPDPSQEAVEPLVQQPPAEPPSLAELLSHLSTRAAARRRNSLLVRQADLAPQRLSIDITRISSTPDMAAVLFQQPDDEAELVEIPRPPTAPHSLFTDAGEPLALRAHPITRSNTDTPRLVRNFSRPRARRAVNDAAGEEVEGSGAEDVSGVGTFGTQSEDVYSHRGRGNKSAQTRQRDQMARRSRSLPAPADRAKSRNTLVEMGSQFESTYDPDTMPVPQTQSRSRRPTDHRQRTEDMNRVRDVSVPRLSPFPRIPVPNRKIKGLGQGSAKWLDERVAQWRDDVNGQAHYRESEEELPIPKSLSHDGDPGINENVVALKRWGSGTGRLSRQNSASRKTALIGTNF